MFEKKLEGGGVRFSYTFYIDYLHNHHYIIFLVPFLCWAVDGHCCTTNIIISCGNGCSVVTI
jgi:hypothetical protein